MAWLCEKRKSVGVYLPGLALKSAVSVTRAFCGKWWYDDILFHPACFVAACVLSYGDGEGRKWDSAI
ncbi:hypothetical protein KCP75_24875 [Salmonella enterica subsp. enterica]|nr:hypothetical protein KCP75_24875 [Salmonella enterica subsp. enterica]